MIIFTLFDCLTCALQKSEESFVFSISIKEKLLGNQKEIMLKLRDDVPVNIETSQLIYMQINMLVSIRVKQAGNRLML